jgi:hypothetical protein
VGQRTGRPPRRGRLPVVLAAAGALALVAIGVASAVIDSSERDDSVETTPSPEPTTPALPTLTAPVPTTTHLGTTSIPTSPPSLGEGGFAGHFERGGWAPFDDFQREDGRPVSDSFGLVEDPVRQGRYAARITVRHGYSRFGHNEDASLVWKSGEKEGDDYWYAWSTQFPPGWAAPFGWGIFAQWHANLVTSPAIAFNARGEEAFLNLHAGLTNETANRFALSRDIRLLSTLSKGRWNDFVLHVRWTTKADGLVEVFHRVEGEPSLRRLVSLRRIPTLQYTSDGRGKSIYVLYGLYRRSHCATPTELGCTGPRGVQSPSIAYQDGFTRATTFEAAVANAFPAPAPALPADGATIGRQRRLPALAVDVKATPAGMLTDRGCDGCLVSSAGGDVKATVAGGADWQDTAVALYNVRQRSTVVVKGKLGVEGESPLSGNVVVTQLRAPDRRILAEVYVAGSDRTLRVFSAPGALTRRGFHLSSGVTVRPGGKARSTELRLTRTSLLLGVDGRERVRVAGLDGPTKGTRLIARIGIDHFDGAADAPVRVTYDDVVVGAAGR